jgi:hypothetical protein
MSTAPPKPDPNWGVRLQRCCPERTKLDVLWRDIASEPQTQGPRFGRQTYGEYSDAEIWLARAEVHSAAPAAASGR